MVSLLFSCLRLLCELLNYFIRGDLITTPLETNFWRKKLMEKLTFLKKEMYGALSVVIPKLYMKNK